MTDEFDAPDGPAPAMESGSVESRSAAESGEPGDVFAWGAVSDVGRVREINQDSMLVREGLFVVADGMGGHRGGEVASAVAVEAMQSVAPSPTIGELVDAVHAANRAVIDRASGDAALIGMGTTLCAVARVRSADPEPQLGVINVGDSRVYVFADGELTQVTDDHSLVGEMLRDGQLTADEAALHPQRNVVTRAIGIQNDLQVDYWELPARTGDRYLLSSDGLFDELSEAQITAVLGRLADPEAVANELVRLANDHGARDNVTVVVVDVIDGADDGPALVSEPPLTDHRSIQPDGDDAMPAAPAEPPAPSDPPEPVATRRPVRRIVTAVVAAVIVLAVILGFVARYARDNYFVTFADTNGAPSESSQVVIFQGRPDGVLWFDPTVEERTPILGLDLTDALILEVEQIPEFDSLDAAQRYVVELTTRATEANG